MLSIDQQLYRYSLLATNLKNTMERYKLAFSSLPCITWRSSPSTSCPPRVKCQRIQRHSSSHESDKVCYKLNRSDSDTVCYKLDPNVSNLTRFKLAKNGPLEAPDEDSLFYRLRPESPIDEEVAVSQEPMPPAAKRPRRSDPQPKIRDSTQTQPPTTRVRSSTSRRSKSKAIGGSNEKAKGNEGSKKQNKLVNLSRSKATLDLNILPSPWTDRDEEIFFDGLVEFGKDFQRIAELFRLCSENPKSMEEIGDYYARTASVLREKFSKPQSILVTRSAASTKTAEQKPPTDFSDSDQIQKELYLLFCYNELRIKCPKSLWKNLFSSSILARKFDDLVANGEARIKIGGAVAEARKEILTISKCYHLVAPTSVHLLPSHILVSLYPVSEAEGCFVLSEYRQNPHVRIVSKTSRSLRELEDIVGTKWNLSSSQKLALTPRERECDVKDSFVEGKETRQEIEDTSLGELLLKQQEVEQRQMTSRRSPTPTPEKRKRPLARKALDSCFVLTLTYRIMNKRDGQSEDVHSLAIRTLFGVAATELGKIDRAKSKKRPNKDNYDEQMLRSRLEDQEKEKEKLDINFELAAEEVERIKKLRVRWTGLYRAVSCLDDSPADSALEAAAAHASGAQYEGQVKGPTDLSRNNKELRSRSRCQLFPDVETTSPDNFDFTEENLAEEMSPETDVNQPSANYRKGYEAKPPTTENYVSIKDIVWDDYMSADQINASFPFDVSPEDFPDLSQIDFGANGTGILASTPVSKFTAAANGKLEDSSLLSLPENPLINRNYSEGCFSAINPVPGSSDDVEALLSSEIEDALKDIVELECSDEESLTTDEVEDAAKSISEISFNLFEMEDCGFPDQDSRADDNHFATPDAPDLNTPKKLGHRRDAF